MNFWTLPNTGKFYVSVNAVAFRILLPASLEDRLPVKAEGRGDLACLLYEAQVAPQVASMGETGTVISKLFAQSIMFFCFVAAAFAAAPAARFSCPAWCRQNSSPFSAGQNSPHFCSTRRSAREPLEARDEIPTFP